MRNEVVPPKHWRRWTGIEPAGWGSPIPTRFEGGGAHQVLGHLHPPTYPEFQRKLWESQGKAGDGVSF